jgi:hypothetical protein
MVPVGTILLTVTKSLLDCKVVEEPEKVSVSVIILPLELVPVMVITAVSEPEVEVIRTRRPKALLVEDAVSITTGVAVNVRATPAVAACDVAILLALAAPKDLRNVVWVVIYDRRALSARALAGSPSTLMLGNFFFTFAAILDFNSG